MQILGIDPGYGTTGFALVEAHRGLHQLRQCGVITTPPGMDFLSGWKPCIWTWTSF